MTRAVRSPESSVHIQNSRATSVFSIRAIPIPTYPLGSGIGNQAIASSSARRVITLRSRKTQPSGIGTHPSDSSGSFVKSSPRSRGAHRSADKRALESHAHASHEVRHVIWRRTIVCESRRDCAPGPLRAFRAQNSDSLDEQSGASSAAPPGDDGSCSDAEDVPLELLARHTCGTTLGAPSVATVKSNARKPPPSNSARMRIARAHEVPFNAQCLERDRESTRDRLRLVSVPGSVVEGKCM